MRFCSPFKVSATRQFEKIGTNDEGYVYLLKTGGLSPVENPAEDQKREKEIAELQWTILQAIRRVAKELDCSVASARKLLFEAPVKEAEQVPKEADAENSDLVVAVEKEKKDADDYLTKEEMFALREMRTSRVDLAKQATTKLMKHRMAYALELSADMPAMSKGFTANIVPAFFEAPKGSSLSVKGGSLVLAEDLKVGDKVVSFEAVTDHPSSKLVKGDALFLTDGTTGAELVGCEWDESMTEGTPYTLLFAIREFFEQEARGVVGSNTDPSEDEYDDSKSADEQDAELGKQSKSSEQPKTKKRSIGNGYSTDSNTSDVATSA